jgi:hypothetical protein
MERGTFSCVRGWKHESGSKGCRHSFDLPDGRRLHGVCTVDSLRLRIEHCPVPEDLCGADAPGIGAGESWYTFGMESHGACPMVDSRHSARFPQIPAALKFRAECRPKATRPSRLETGWHDVKVWVGDAVSNSKRSAVDLPVRISELNNGIAGQPGVRDSSPGIVLYARADGLPANVCITPEAIAI